jgi:hypothetical protein
VRSGERGPEVPTVPDALVGNWEGSLASYRLELTINTGAPGSLVAVGYLEPNVGEVEGWTCRHVGTLAEANQRGLVIEVDHGSGRVDDCDALGDTIELAATSDGRLDYWTERTGRLGETEGTLSRPDDARQWPAERLDVPAELVGLWRGQIGRDGHVRTRHIEVMPGVVGDEVVRTYTVSGQVECRGEGVLLSGRGASIELDTEVDDYHSSSQCVSVGWQVLGLDDGQLSYRDQRGNTGVLSLTADPLPEPDR